MPNAFGVPCFVVASSAAAAAAQPTSTWSSKAAMIAGLADAEKFHVDLLYNYARAAGVDV